MLFQLIYFENHLLKIVLGANSIFDGVLYLKLGANSMVAELGMKLLFNILFDYKTLVVFFLLPLKY